MTTSILIVGRAHTTRLAEVMGVRAYAFELTSPWRDKVHELRETVIRSEHIEFVGCENANAMFFSVEPSEEKEDMELVGGLRRVEYVRMIVTDMTIYWTGSLKGTSIDFYTESLLLNALFFNADPGPVMVMHSSLDPGNLLERWPKIKSGEEPYEFG